MFSNKGLKGTKRGKNFDTNKTNVVWDMVRRTNFGINIY